MKYTAQVYHMLAAEPTDTYNVAKYIALNMEHIPQVEMAPILDALTTALIKDHTPKEIIEKEFNG